jgi:hypothetical protein
MLYHANALRVDENMRMKPITQTYNNVSHHHDLQGSQCSVGLQCRQILPNLLELPLVCLFKQSFFVIFCVGSDQQFRKEAVDSKAEVW